MFAKPPNGYLVSGQIIFGHLGAHGYAAKGFQMDVPDLRHGQSPTLNHLQEQESLLLRSLDENQRIQFQWYCDSDFTAELGRYDRETEKTANDWVRVCRSERFERYWKLMREGKLRRQRLALFISRRVTVAPRFLASPQHLLRHYQSVLDQLNEEASQFHHQLIRTWGPEGIRALPMTDEDHHRQFARFLNPSFAERGEYDSRSTFDSSRSIQENCWTSQGVGVPNTGFSLDGFYHAVLVLRRWPQVTFPGIIHKLTCLGHLNYTVTLNIEPLPVQAEIAKEQRAYIRLSGQLATTNEVSLETVLNKKKTKIKGLMEGFIRPFRAELIVRTWARTKEALAAQVAALEQAIHSMNGAQYLHAALPTTARNLFYQSWPGWLWGRYDHYKLYAEDQYLADLIPLTTSFSAYASEADALYEC